MFLFADLYYWNILVEPGNKYSNKLPLYLVGPIFVFIKQLFDACSLGEPLETTGKVVLA